MKDENLLLHTLAMCPYLTLFLPVSFPLAIFELYVQFQPNKTKESQRKFLGNRQARKRERLNLQPKDGEAKACFLTLLIT